MIGYGEREEILKSNPEEMLESDGGLFVDKLGLAVNFIGAFCALIGLVEIIRLIAYYWETYGLLANFPLEISIYVIGILWIFVSFINFLTSKTRFLEGLR